MENTLYDFFLGGGGGVGGAVGVKEVVGVMCFLDLEWSFEQALRATLPLCMLQIKITFR